MRSFLIIVTILMYPMLVWAQFDHTHHQWNQLIKEHVKLQVDGPRVDYAKLHKHPEQLHSYIEKIQALSEKDYELLTNHQKIALLINYFNAQVWLMIIQHYPLESMSKLSSFLSTPYSRKNIHFIGKKLSLEEIQDKHLRKELKEPRALLALCGGYLTSAPIFLEAFRADKVEQQLNEQSKNFIMNKRTVNFRSKDKTIWLSKLFKLYGADFNARYKGYERFIRQFINYPNETPVEWIETDWTLNDFK
jgi:hypothetical protein